MSESIVFGVPRVPVGMLPRAGLLERVGATPLTVIRGPGGAGKTVLMSQWVETVVAPGLWVSVGPDTADRFAFWAAVVEGAAHAGMAIHLPVQESARDGRDALRAALVRGFRAVHGAFVLVIDDAHELGDPLVFHDLLEILHACPSVQAVVGTRVLGTLEAPREALTLDVTVIAPDELALTVAEIDDIVGDGGSRYGTSDELLEASGGNPLLLRAVLAGASTGAASRDSATAIVRDLLSGLFERESPSLGAFASATAVPDEIGIPFAAHLSGVDSARVEEMLGRLEVDGLLMHSDGPDGPRFRYHPVVRAVLRDQLRASDRDGYRRLNLVASAAAEREGRYLLALRHAVDAEDYGRASDICLHGGITLLRSRGAAAILQRVPMRYVARLPFIAIVLGLAANARGERWSALELLTLALGASRASRSRQRPAERVGLALVESVVLRVTGRASESMAAARRMTTLLDQASADDLVEIAGQLDAFRLQGALSLFRGGALSEALIAAERAGTSVEALTRLRPEALGAASVVAAVQAIRGQSSAAADTLTRIDASEYPTELRDGYVGSLAHLASAVIALDAGDADRAETELDTLNGMTNLEHLMLLTVVRSLIALWRGRTQTGLRLLEERAGFDRPRARLSREDRQAHSAARALLHASLGQLGAAHDALKTLDRDDSIRALLEAAILLLEQRPDLVRERIARLGDLPGPRLQSAADVLMACASVLTGDEQVAEIALRRFLAADAIDGMQSSFILIPDTHRAPLLALAERLGADVETIARLAALPAPFSATGARVVLTPREGEVLAALRTDASQARIAASLGVSANTVKSQTRTLYRKLGAASREDALRAAYLQGLLDASVD
jgi:LuxR family maltose regulon positive regulatory protein